MKYFYHTIIIVFLFSSCATTNLVTLEIREPALISFPPEVTNVVIVDNSPSMEEKGEYEHNHGKETIMPIDSARIVLLKHLQKFTNEEKYFNNVELYPYRTNRGVTSDDVAPLSKRKVQSICREKKADALISFDLFVTSAQLETVNTAYFSNYSILGAKIGTLIRVYSEEGVQYTPPIVYMDSLFREEATDWSRLKNNIPEINDLIYEMSVVGADRLTGKFIPSWKSQDRWYYSDNSSQMKVAAKYVQAGKWQAAVDIWGTLFDQEKNTKKKIRLASNIALANEYLDDIENALGWIDTAFELLPQKSNSELAVQVAIYKKLLGIRMQNRSKLHEQLGIEDMVDETIGEAAE